MKVAILGLSHKTAPVSLRERFAQNTAELSKTLQAVTGLGPVTEACIISTCNRVEYYVAGDEKPANLIRALKGYLLSFSGLPPRELEQHLYLHEGQDCLRHLFRVSCSLDSMVLGEPQILGQVKEAYKLAEESQTLGGELTRTFQKAFGVAKRIRSETGIAENAVSMSFAAVELGREIFDSLDGKEVLLVGAGKMATLAARHLQSHGVARVRVASRSLATAQKLADAIGATASSLADLPLLLASADIVICSTAAPGHVITKKMMSKVVRERRYRPILFVDIAVPRDVESKVSDLDNCFVYDVDDLESVLELNREARRREAQAAERMIEVELQAHLRWNKTQQVVPVIKALRKHAMGIADSEIQRTLSNVPGADKKTEQSVRAMGQAIVNKMLHPVLTRLKEEGAQGDPQAMVDALTTLFDLARVSEEEPPAENVVVLRQGKDKAQS